MVDGGRVARAIRGEPCDNGERKHNNKRYQRLLPKRCRTVGVAVVLFELLEIIIHRYNVIINKASVSYY